MLFKSKVNLALRILRYMTERTVEGGVATVIEMSTELDASMSYVEQVVSVLRDNSLVKGKRGPGGGYVLLRDTAKRAKPFTYANISILDLTCMLYSDVAHISQSSFLLGDDYEPEGRVLHMPLKDVIF